MEPLHTLETPRLILRRPALDDAPVIFSTYAQDAEVTRYLTWRPHETVEDTVAFLTRALQAWKDGSSFTWAITLRDSGVLIGMIDVRLECHANLGYVLARPYWNRGYMTEAVRAVIAWALGQEEVCRVWAVCDIENIASARVLQKAGMEQEGILRRWMVLPNRATSPRDCSCFAVVK